MFSVNRHDIGTGSSRLKAAVIAGVIGLLPLAAGASQGAPAQLGGDAVVVRYADLDIHTPPGAEMLYARIEHAAEQLCPQADFREIQRHLASLRCRDEVVAHAVSRINSPQLAAVYASRTHRVAHSPV
jgi:UrcA family protein